MSITRKSLADTIDGYDAEIASLQESKRETFQAYRDQVTELSGKDAAKDEIEAVKKAIRRRQAATKKGVDVVDAADALADEVFEEITAARAPRAMRVREGDKSEEAETSIIEGRSESASGAASDSAPNNSRAKATNGKAAEVAGHDGQPETGMADADGVASRLSVGSGTDAPNSPETAIQSTAARMGVHRSYSADGSTDTHLREPIDAVAHPQETADPSGAGTQARPVDTDPRAFIKQLRPHCQHPDACGGHGRHYCFGCSVKIKDDPAESEAA